MVKATWRILALSALMGSVALPAAAQVVIGGSGQPSVEVNWAVLDSLGRQPTLADMLKEDGASRAASTAGKPAPASAGVAYRPYKPQAEKGRKVSAEPKKAKATPVALKQNPPPVAPAVAELVQAAQQKIPAAKAPEPKVVPVKAEAKPEPKPEPAKAEAKPEPKPEPKPAGPQISLPEIKPTPIATVEPAPAPAPKAEPAKPAAAPMQIAKVEPAPAPAPAVIAPVPASVIPAPALTPAPVPPPAPVAKAEPAAVLKGDTISVLFSGEDAKLPGGAQSDLLALAKRMEKDEGLGLQLLAYAAGDDSGASKARRLSLSRALEVRKFLMEQGVRSTRIEVRALGNKMEGPGPADRVDAVVVSR